MKKLNLTTLFAIVIATQAFADIELETVEVESLRGDKEERSYLETNQSVSVLKSKNLNRGDVQNSVQMLTGLSNIQQSSRDENSFSIRGISDMGVTGFQKDSLASMLVDDVFQTPLSLRAGSFEQWDLESIEVHRGAQSTTQGVNSLAGNILLFHAAPKEENAGAAKLTLGNYGRREGAVLLNHKINDKLLFRTSYNKELYDGYIENKTTGNDKWGARNKDHFVADLLWKISASSSLRFNLKLLRLNKGGEYVQGNNYEDYEVTENNDFKSISNGQQAAVTYEKRFNENLSSKTVFAFTRADNNTFSDGDGTPQNTAGERYENAKDSFMSLESVLNMKGRKWRNTLGVHFHKYELNEFYDFNLLTPAPLPVTQENDKERTIGSLFDSFIYDFNQHHSVNIGGRVEVVKNDFSADIIFPTTGTVLDNSRGKYGDDNTNTILLPKLSYTYKNKNYSVGTFYSEGYRTGGLSINRFQSKAVEYDPEKTQNYELSWKMTSEKFLFTANVFYTRWLEQQVETRISNQTYDTQVENASTSELYGAEIEGNLEVTEKDSFRLNVGTVKTQFLSFTNNGTSYTGNEFPDAAKYTAQFSWWRTYRDDLMGILTTRYLSKSWSDPENTRRSPEQIFLDYNLQYYYKDFVVEGFVRNILDKNYRIYNGRPRTTSTAYPASYHRMSPPREFGARINYFW